MISIKPGAVLIGLKVEILLGLIIIEKVFTKHGFDVIITEGSGGKHMIGSLHHIGLAIDLRSKHIKNSNIQLGILKESKELLGTSFQMILEHQNKANEHYHLEFDPK